MTTRTYDFIVGPETSTTPSEGTVETIKSATKSGSYTITDADGLGTIFVDAAGTVTLPTAADNIDRRILVVNDSTGQVIVDGEGAETINGQASVYINNRYDYVYVHCDGSEWFTISEVPLFELQDFTTIGSIGDTDQQHAGHIWPSDLWGTGTDIAYYKFASGALTTDEEGTYSLTNNNSATNTTGIMNTNFATALNGTTQYYTQGTLLDDNSIFTNAMTIDFWFKADDGKSGLPQRFLNKVNDGNNSIYIQINGAAPNEGRLHIGHTISGTAYTLWSNKILNNGAEGWHHLLYTQDSTNGARLFMDGMYQNSNPNLTSYMGNGTSSDLHIGSSITPNYYYGGDIAQLRFSNVIITQKHIDLALASRIARPAIFTNDDFNIKAFVQEDGSSDFQSQIPFSEIEVHRNSNYIYRKGFVFDATDKLRLIGGIS